MILALLVTTLGFATLILVQEATSPPLVYGAYYAGTLFALYLGVRLLLPHSDVLLLPIVTPVSYTHLTLPTICSV